MFIVAMIVATVGALVTIVLYGSVLSNGMGAGNFHGFLKVRRHLQEKLVNFFREFNVKPKMSRVQRR